MPDLPEQTIAAAVLSCAGILYCFFGYRLFQVMLAVNGALSGAMIGYQLIFAMVPKDPVLPWVGALVGGAGGAVLCFFAYYVAVFLFAFIAGYVAVLHYGHAIGEPMVRFVGAGVGVVLGLLGLWIQRVVLTLGTAIIGGLSFAVAVELLRERLKLDTLGRDLTEGLQRLGPERNWVLAGAAVFALVGAVFQFSNYSGSPAPAKSGKSPAKKKPKKDA